MAKTSFLSALTGLALSAMVLAGGTSAAQAESLSLGFDFGNGQFSIGVDDGQRRVAPVEHRWDRDRHFDRDRHWDRDGHWDRDRDRHSDRWWRDHRDHRGDRWDRGGRKIVEICEPVVRVKRIYDRWGNVVKKVRIREEECRRVRR